MDERSITLVIFGVLKDSDVEIIGIGAQPLYGIKVILEPNPRPVKNTVGEAVRNREGNYSQKNYKSIGYYTGIFRGN